MRGFPSIHRFFGIGTKARHSERTSNPTYVESNVYSSVIKAPPWLVERMEALRNRPPPTLDEVDTQMKFSAAMRKCLDEGMSYEEAQAYVTIHATGIKAGLDSP